MTIDRFLSSEHEQRAYWARSHIGWERFRHAAPNVAHHAVTALQRAGMLRGVVTQNVDGLHPAAGTTGVFEIHGRLDEVVCLDCAEVSGRDRLATRLEARNPGFRDRVSTDETSVRPDGDILLRAEDVDRFAFVGCETCGGRVKPGVTMFGEQVPRERYAQARALVEDARSLVVLGSSLSVGSGYRFVLDAVRRGLPIAIVTRGRTRGDEHATVRVDDDLCDVLPPRDLREDRSATSGTGAAGAVPDQPGSVAPQPATATMKAEKVTPPRSAIREFGRASSHRALAVDAPDPAASGQQ